MNPASRSCLMARSNVVVGMPYFFAVLRENFTPGFPPASIAKQRYRKRAPEFKLWKASASKREFPTCINRPSRQSVCADSQGLSGTFLAVFFLGTSYVLPYFFLARAFAEGFASRSKCSHAANGATMNRPHESLDLRSAAFGVWIWQEVPAAPSNGRKDQGSPFPLLLNFGPEQTCR